MESSGQSLPSKKPSKDKNTLSYHGSQEEFYKAKAFLMKASSDTSLNVYDHLSDLVGKVLEGRPENIADFVEELSLWLKKSKLQYKEDSLIDSVEASTKYLQALKDKKLFQGGAGDISIDDDEGATNGEIDDEQLKLADFSEIAAIIPNLQDTFFFLEQAGITINKNEVYRINLSMIKLLRMYPIYRLRFWGKIIGLEKNYAIVETEFHFGEELGDGESDEMDGTIEPPRTVTDSFPITNEKPAEEEYGPPLPKPKLVPTLVVPPEPFRSGANTKIYFAATAPEFNWVRLPLVTPAQISAARNIRKFFTGRFNATVHCYPPFPGKEMHLLRAQIARITSSTQISPSGFYNADGEDKIVENEAYESIPVTSLVDDFGSNWVHHSQYLLPQGRCTWAKHEWIAPKKPEGDDEEDDEDAPVLGWIKEEEFDEVHAEPEVGPPLLSPISEDSIPEGLQLWTANLSPSAFPQHAVAVVKSLLWPGAFAIAREKESSTIYIGYGIKYPSSPYTPAPPPPVMNEYPISEDLFEAIDPSPEEEAVYKQTTEGEAEVEEEEEEIA